MPPVAIHKCRLFRDLSPDAIQRLVEASQSVSAARGDAIFRKGQDAMGVFLILSGQIKLCIETTQGEEHVAEIRGEGEHFGEVATVMQRPHLITAVAVTACKLQHVCGRAVLAELATNHRLAWNMSQELAAQLYGRMNDLENLLFRKAEKRVARYLMDVWVESGRKAGNVIHLPARKGLIASRLHMTKEHFSRTLRELSDQGVLTVHHLDIEVNNREALEKLSN